MGNFDEADPHKSYARAQGKDDETVNITSRSSQIGRKLHARTNKASPPDINISPAEDLSITSGLTHEAAADEDISLLGGASLSIDPEGDDISLLGIEASLTGGDVYPPGEDSLGASTATCYTSTSELKQATSILTQEFNATLKKGGESDAPELAEEETSEC